MKRLLALIDGKKTVISIAIILLGKYLAGNSVPITDEQVMNAMHSLPVQLDAAGNVYANVTQGVGLVGFIIGIIHHFMKAWNATKPQA